jgi:hypothetical protein
MKKSAQKVISLYGSRAAGHKAATLSANRADD